MFLLCKCYTLPNTTFMNYIQMFYDWQVLVVRWKIKHLVEFFSPSRQKEWFKIWKIKDQPNHTNHMKEPQSSHCLVVHEDSHLSYKRYKVRKFCFKSHPRYTSTNIHKHTLFLYFSIFLIKKKHKTRQKQTNKQTRKALKLDWLKPQLTPCMRSRKWRNHLESFSFQIEDLDGESFFCVNLCLEG